MQTITTVRRGRPRSAHLLVLIFTLCAAAFAQAQEGQQAQEKAPTLAEAKTAFAKADRALNQAWSAAKAAAAEESRERRLTVSQREWLDFREERAREESERAGEKDAKRSPIYHSIAAELTDARTEWLRARTRSEETEEKLTGTWVDSYGGTLQVVQQEQRLLFLIHVVRGPTYHTGSVAGIASWNQPLGWWSDKGLVPDKTEESNLAFVERDRCLEVIGANTLHYHGARAYFDGVYCKVGPLGEKEQAEVIKAAESGDVSHDQEEGGG